MATPPPDKSPDRITPGQAMEPVGKPMTPPGPTGFQSYMQGTPGSAPAPGAPGTAGPNPMEASRGAPLATGTPTYQTLLAQTNNIQDSLGTVNEQLDNKNLKFKRSQAHLMKNKLSDSNQYIRAAGSKLGIDAPPMKVPPGSSPLDRFIAYVNDGQDQLVAVQQKLKELSASGAQMRPGDMMYLQVKMGLATQEIEYTSTLLGKIITSITTIMNTQL